MNNEKELSDSLYFIHKGFDEYIKPFDGKGYIECFHYTSPDGFKNIIETNKLRFCDAKYLNDASEGEYLYKLIEERLANPLKKYNNRFVSLIRKYILNQDVKIENDNEQDNAPFELPSHYFVCCFSCNHDSLSLWNYYTKTINSIGYNLGFQTDLLSETFAQHWEQVKCYKVVYDKKAQEDYIDNILVIGLSNKWESDNEDFVRKDIIFYLQVIFNKMKYIFKNSAFKDENEIRFLIEMTEQDFQKNLIKKGDDEIKFYNKNGVMVPYLESSFDKSLLIHIGVSPTIKNNNIDQSIKLFAQKNGYNKIKVQRSNIPLQF